MKIAVYQDVVSCGLVRIAALGSLIALMMEVVYS